MAESTPAAAVPGPAAAPPSALLGEVDPEEAGPLRATGRVAVVLVSHDGAGWLPTVLAGLAEQRAAPWRVVAVDTGSRDHSRELLAGHPAVDEVLDLPAATGYPAAVAAGVEAAFADGAPEAHRDDDWIWLLHDDSTPEAGALEHLLHAAAGTPGQPPDLLGPKLREWPSLRRLLELGVTISGTGRRETGLERGEYDQGQHDEPGHGSRDVLAVNTAGLLVRRTAWESLDGLDERLVVFGNDLDLGWRAAATGRRTVVVPSAVVFHVEAAHRGVRRTALTGRHTHVAERRAALYTLLVNGSARSLPFRMVRLVLGTLVRMVGFLLVRSPGEALDDLTALLSVLARPGELRAARRERREVRRRGTGPSRADDLLAPAWLPYRHGLDVVGDLVAAATSQAADVAERRREERAAEQAERTATGRRNRHRTGEAGPGSGTGTGTGGRVGAGVGEDQVEDAALGRGPVARFLTDPLALAVTAFLALTLGSLFVSTPGVGAAGGALAPAPASAADWWALHLDGRHAIGLSGTELPAPPYVWLLALLGTLLLGSASATVVAVQLAAVPVALWGAWRLLRVAARLAQPDGAPRGLLAAGAAAYAVVPLTSGAWAQGRIGVVVLAALLPWLGHAALGFLEPEPDRRRRAGWRCGLLLTVVVAFVPSTWPVAVALVALTLLTGLVLSPRGMRASSAWAPLLVAVLVPALLLAPWVVGLLAAGRAEGLLLEAGTPPVVTASGSDLLLGRLGDPSAWWWLALAPAALAVLALLVPRTRGAVVVCWAVALVTLAVGGALSLLRLDLDPLTVPVSAAPVVVVVAGASIVAAVLGALALPPRPLGGAAVAVVLAAAAVGGPVWSAVAANEGDGGDTAAADSVPTYMTEASTDDPADGILLARGDVETGLAWVVRRGDGTTLGEAELEALGRADAEDEAAVATLLGRPDPEVVERLPALGISYVVLPDADGRVAVGLDAVAGLAQAGAEDRATRAWEVDEDLAAEVAEDLSGDTAGDAAAYEPRSRTTHTVLVVVQLVLLLVVAVLCGPSRRRNR